MSDAADRELLEQVLAELRAGVNVRAAAGIDELPAWVGAVLPIEGVQIAAFAVPEHQVIAELAHYPGACELRFEIDGQRVWERRLEYAAGAGLELGQTL